MATLVLPIDSTPDNYVVVELDGNDYGFRTRWNARNSSWHMSVYDSEGEAIILNKRIGSDAWLGRNILQLSGFLAAISIDETDKSDPGEFDLGERVLIIYNEP
jgi:hypothetical protein